MDTEELRGIEERMCGAGRAGGILALSMAGMARSSRTVKPDMSLVTEADRACEEMLRVTLGRILPGAGFLGEETGGRLEGFTWVVDPIDGTSNYVSGNPFWCVSVALLRDGVTVAGAVHDPNVGETFSVREGSGPRIDGRPFPDLPDFGQRRITCIGFSRGEGSERARDLLGHVMQGSGAVRSRALRRSACATWPRAGRTCSPNPLSACGTSRRGRGWKPKHVN